MEKGAVDGVDVVGRRDRGVHPLSFSRASTIGWCLFRLFRLLRLPKKERK
jgi:hypothetical protein